MSDDYGGRFDELARLSYRVAHRMLGDREEARDVAQEAMTRAFVHWRRARRHPEPWVARVTSNLAIDRLRHRGRSLPEPVLVDADVDHAAVQRLELVRALAELPRRQRQVVVLRYLADLPEKRVAAELGCSPGAVKAHASRGLAALRAALADPVPIALAPEEC